VKKIIASLSVVFIFVCFANSQEVRDGQTVKPSLNVVLENILFSPLTKTKEGVIFYPAVKGANKIKLWTFTVRDENGDIVKILSGRKKLPEKIVWDGLNNDGFIVADGRYSAEIYVQTDKGDFKFDDPGIIVDNTPPFVSLKAADDVYFIDRNGKMNKNINLYLSCGDENEIDSSGSYIKVINYKDKEVKDFKFEEKIPEIITWDGTDDIYDAFLRPGNYRIIFLVSDRAGNKESVKYEISVIEYPKEKEQVLENNKTEQSE